MTDKALLEAVEEMSARSETLQTEIKAARAEAKQTLTFGRTNRKYIRLLVFSVIFDVVLSLALGGIALQSRDAAAEAKAATTASRIASNNLKVICEASNIEGDKQKFLWKSIIQFPPPLNETPAEKTDRLKRTKQFQTLLNKTFAEQDCSQVGR